MKRMKAILILSLFCAILSAPPFKVAVILQPEAIRVFDPILKAFQMVESSFRTDVVNSLGYTGILQEGPEMIAEANRICLMRGIPDRFTFPESALDSLQSVKIWYIVQTYWNPNYELRKAAKIWNPLASVNYYAKIKKQLNTDDKTIHRLDRP